MIVKMNNDNLIIRRILINGEIKSTRLAILNPIPEKSNSNRYKVLNIVSESCSITPENNVFYDFQINKFTWFLRNEADKVSKCVPIDTDEEEIDREEEIDDGIDHNKKFETTAIFVQYFLPLLKIWLPSHSRIVREDKLEKQCYYCIKRITLKEATEIINKMLDQNYDEMMSFIDSLNLVNCHGKDNQFLEDKVVICKECYDRAHKEFEDRINKKLNEFNKE
jgi:hypothetical protein